MEHGSLTRYLKNAYGSGIKVIQKSVYWLQGLCEKARCKKQSVYIAYYHVKLAECRRNVEKTIKHGTAVERLLYLELPR